MFFVSQGQPLMAFLKLWSLVLPSKSKQVCCVLAEIVAVGIPRIRSVAATSDHGFSKSRPILGKNSDDFFQL